MPACVGLDLDLVALLEHGAELVKVGRRSKRPIGLAWQDRATQCPDRVASWLARGYNVGLLLGRGGLIDVEYDNAAGRRLVKKLGIASVQTPTYTSCRGEHRLFRLTTALPECGWHKVGDVEVRLGGRPAQSVLPPSQHPDGETYRWTISPRDCEPARVTLADLCLEVE